MEEFEEGNDDTCAGGKKKISLVTFGSHFFHQNMLTPWSLPTKTTMHTCISPYYTFTFNATTPKF